MKKIPIFFAFNNDYAEPAAVAFYSLLDKAKENIFYEMYVLHSDITEEKQKLLKNIVSKKENGKLTFINTGNFLTNFWEKESFNFGHANSVFTIDTLTRCFAARFFPQYDKIIYSDVDIVVTDDISDLYDINLNNKYIAGVKNIFSQYSPAELSHLSPKHYEMLKDCYIGGGILVMNLKKIRADNLEQKMLEIIKDKTIFKRWPDQDVLNIACAGNTYFISPNYVSIPYLLELLQKPNFTSDYTTEELYDSLINPKIIHFAANKPWNNTPHYSNLWWTYFHYLNLEKTAIFKENRDPKLNKLKKKCKKYMALSIIFFIALLLSLLFCH